VRVSLTPERTQALRLERVDDVLSGLPVVRRAQNWRLDFDRVLADSMAFRARIVGLCHAHIDPLVLRELLT
jgi:hypothetical protein